MKGFKVKVFALQLYILQGQIKREPELMQTTALTMRHECMTRRRG